MVRHSLLVAASLICVSCTQNTPETDKSLAFPEEIKWIRADADISAVLTIEPSECLPELGRVGNAGQLKLGRLAFRSPYLLGGQATRRGLSCHTCHTNGDVNKDFFIQGLSGETGTADVTSFHFSTTLGDETFNPKAIPSLVSLPDPIDLEARNEREAFILRLVEKEFDGNTPSKMISDALIAYVNTLDPQYCSSSKWSEIELLGHQLLIIDTAIDLLNAYSENENENEEFAFIQSALRHELGRLSERFPESKKLRAGLVALSLQIKASDREIIPEISSDWQLLRSEFKSEFHQSFYSEEYVRSIISRN